MIECASISRRSHVADAFPLHKNKQQIVQALIFYAACSAAPCFWFSCPHFGFPVGFLLAFNLVMHSPSGFSFWFLGFPADSLLCRFFGCRTRPLADSQACMMRVFDSTAGQQVAAAWQGLPDARRSEERNSRSALAKPDSGCKKTSGTSMVARRFA